MPTKSEKSSLIVPILMLAVGTGWLLTTIGVAPGINWAWTLSLAVLGCLAFVTGGFDKATVVSGVFLATASFLSVLRQTGRLSFDVEVPILVIVFGALLLIVRHPAIPTPRWMIGRTEQQQIDRN